MPTSAHGETLLAPDLRPDPAPDDAGAPAILRRRHRTTTARPTTLPADLLKQASSRLQGLALLYAFTFLMADFVPQFVVGDAPTTFFSNLAGVLSISAALIIVWVLRSARLQTRAVMALALVFEVVSSYGIATAEFWRPGSVSVQTPWVGLSWVAAWVLIFNVVVPTLPRYAVIAALAAVTSVPVVVVAAMSAFPPPVPPAPLMIFFGFVFPYILIVVMAYVGARIIYALGTEVSRARELGSYRLVERLGSGGMGEVWKANHRFLARPAAIKLIRPPAAGDSGGAVSDQMRLRFEREAQVIAQLRSPHTVTLFDFGVAEDGAFYYAMELLDGVDADTLVKRFGPLPPERVVHVLRQMCHSLSEAESCGLVHRDIKPANIFLSRYGEDHDFVKILDFGLAKATSGQSSQTSTTEAALTVANVVHGTPAFIAPEQALGTADLDIRTDLYATGCVAYWLLTGQLVFTAETPMALLLAHVHTPPAAPSTKTDVPIPGALDALILSCLSKDRANRPRSARHLLQALEDLPMPERWTDDRARTWWRTHLPASRAD